MEDKTATYKPKREERVQVAHTQTAKGEAAYILHNPDSHTYLEIDAQNYFLWELMDGEHELGAIAMAYYAEYSAFPFDRLSQLITQLESNYLLEGTSPKSAQAPASEEASRVKRFADNAFQREFNWQNADEFFGRFYRRVGWIFYTRPGLIVLGLITLVGIACFVYLRWAKGYRLFRVSESYGWAIIVVILASYFVLFWHESGHGLTCKSFGRSIRKAGLMFFYGKPTFYVDVSDMWMAPRGQRIWVSLAGPIMNLLAGSILAILTMLLSSSKGAQVLFISAFVAYLYAFLNLNPLLEYDGYYILIDWMNTQRLRQNSFTFVRKDLLAKIRTQARFTREETMYSVYGVLASVWTVVAVLIAVYLWERELQMMVRSLVAGEDVLAAVLVGGLTLMASTWLIIGLAARLTLWVGARRGRHREIPEGGGEAL